MFDFVASFRILALNAALSIMVGVLAWRRRRRPGGACLTWMMGALAFWQTVAALEAASVPLEAKLLWSTLEYAGSGFTAVWLVLFARRYVGGGSPGSRLQPVLLSALPAAGLFLTATNPWHGLVWTAVTPGPVGSNQVIYHHGPLFWLITLWFYAYLAGAIWLLLHATRPVGHLSRRQIRPFLLAMVFPWAASVLYLLDLNPIPGLNLIPASFLPTSFLFLYALLREGLLDLVPVARDHVVESMGEGVVVATEDWIVVDMNPAAETLLGVGPADCLGRALPDCVPQMRPWCDATVQPAGDDDHSIEVQDGRVTLALTRSVVRGSNHSVMGFVVLLVDISRQKEAEEERERLIQQLQQSLADVKTLTGLLPICAGCKKMRDDSGYWHSVEAYLRQHSDAQLSHALCPDCLRHYYPDDADDILARGLD